MGKKLKNLTISPLPLVATTPNYAAIVEDVTPLSLVFGVDGKGSPPSTHTSPESGYFLRSGKNIFTGGLGKESHRVSRGRGHTSFLENDQSRAWKDLNEGKQISIERAL